MIHQFSASHFSKGNTIFTTKVIIDDISGTLTVQKRRLVGYDETTLMIKNIISVGMKTISEKIIFSVLSLNTASGILNLNGFMMKDAQKIKKIIEDLMF